MITLDGASLTIEEVVAVAEGRARVRIAAEAKERMQRSRDRVEVAMRGTTPVYALNTGVGLLANIRLEDHEIEEMQVNLIRSHCCGVGAPLPVRVVRGMMLLRGPVADRRLLGRAARAGRGHRRPAERRHPSVRPRARVAGGVRRPGPARPCGILFARRRLGGRPGRDAGARGSGACR